MSLFGRLGVSTLEAMRGWAGEARSRTSRAVQGSAPTSDHAANQVRRGPARADSSQRERLAEPGWSERCVVDREPCPLWGAESGRSWAMDRLFEGKESVLHLMGWVGRPRTRGRFVDGQATRLGKPSRETRSVLGWR
jgi:hypothetical protein